jgi:hypothetical protein
MTRMTRAIKWLLFALLLSVLSGKAAKANTYTAKSCNTSDVQASINSASDGDTVIIPNGSCSWSTGISTAKQLTLQGQTVGGVTITDMAGDANLLSFTIGSTHHTTIANLRFMPGNGTGNYITVNGVGQVPLMHDMYFNLPNFQLQHAVMWTVTGGVIWNTTFESTATALPGSDSGSLLVKSNVPWDTPSTTGTLDTNGDKNLYIEDSTFKNVGQSPDVDDNGRVAIRHSTFIGSAGLTHGPSSAQGGRQVELYNNAFSYPDPNRNMNRWFWLRAGTMIVTQNNIDWINGPSYPNKNSFTFIVEAARWNTGGHGCLTGYMGFHQVGSGATATVQSPTKLALGQLPPDPYQVSDPVYIWNNSGTGNGIAHVGLNDASTDNCNNTNPATGVEYTTADFFVLNRDYFVDNGAKPGWQPYPYPHPLRGTSSTTPPGAPANLAAVVQ